MHFLTPDLKGELSVIKTMLINTHRYILNECNHEFIHCQCNYKDNNWQFCLQVMWKMVFLILHLFYIPKWTRDCLLSTKKETKVFYLFVKIWRKYCQNWRYPNHSIFYTLCFIYFVKYCCFYENMVCITRTVNVKQKQIKYECEPICVNKILLFLFRFLLHFVFDAGSVVSMKTCKTELYQSKDWDILKVFSDAKEQ